MKLFTSLIFCGFLFFFSLQFQGERRESNVRISEVSNESLEVHKNSRFRGFRRFLTNYFEVKLSFWRIWQIFGDFHRIFGLVRYYSLLPKATRGLFSRFLSFSENCKVKNEKPKNSPHPKTIRGLISEYFNWPQRSQVSREISFYYTFWGFSHVLGGFRQSLRGFWHFLGGFWQFFWCFRQIFKGL